ncbi:hypothetical protein C5167_041485 [Papaver somniferum]|nr:hypothetical protein C5167_041485 [Papaver somniferum]
MEGSGSFSLRVSGLVVVADGVAGTAMYELVLMEKEVNAMLTLARRSQLLAVLVIWFCVLPLTITIVSAAFPSGGDFSDLVTSATLSIVEAEIGYPAYIAARLASFYKRAGKLK